MKKANDILVALTYKGIRIEWTDDDWYSWEVVFVPGRLESLRLLHDAVKAAIMTEEKANECD